MSYRSALRPQLLDGQVVIVTGAGSGIGRCTAHEVATLGAMPVLLGRKLEKLERVRDELAQDGLACSLRVMDIRDATAVREGVAAILAEHGRIDGLVNNAGGQFPSPLRDISDKGWDAVVRNNLNGGFTVMREVYQQWMEAHGGAIVNVVASVDFGMPSMGHTGAARAGMINLTQTAALEWVHRGVRVNAVAPGSIATSGMGTYNAEFQQRLKARRRQIPYQRMGTEAEVSASICFLLSEAAAYITGVVLPVDGGLRLAKHLHGVPEHQSMPAFDPFGKTVLPDFLNTPEGN
ncbi:MAG: 2,4-dienoyl-CoA reductase [Polycyclovorans sp.]|nr:2,4-dienoyl-CoA reductase [Polycyclovorans sp.]MDP1693281.1 SDR family oxidoreductase [Burkholderiaceae bacterium]|tara:strand:- start:14889 stop:15764 length:876 start_codon:yes stop_codon:yes gene_type:complete